MIRRYIHNIPHSYSASAFWSNMGSLGRSRSCGSTVGKYLATQTLLLRARFPDISTYIWEGRQVTRTQDEQSLEHGSLCQRISLYSYIPKHSILRCLGCTGALQPKQNSILSLLYPRVTFLLDEYDKFWTFQDIRTHMKDNLSINDIDACWSCCKCGF